MQTPLYSNIRLGVKYKLDLQLGSNYERNIALKSHGLLIFFGHFEGMFRKDQISKIKDCIPFKQTLLTQLSDGVYMIYTVATTNKIWVITGAGFHLPKEVLHT